MTQQKANLSERAFLGLSALAFIASALALFVRCTSSPAICLAPMPGGMERSMVWSRMPGQTWLGAEASFLAMWSLMTATMMLPCLVPVLLRYRRRILQSNAGTVDHLTVLITLGYFSTWLAIGLILFPAGAAVIAIATQLPASKLFTSLTPGVLTLAAGALQFTTWKKRQLVCCRPASCCQASPAAADAQAAWRYGLNLGLHCSQCCAGLMTVLVVTGIMDLRAMALVTAAITLERLSPVGVRIAHLTGGAAIAAGLFILV
jgi:predicted metal-binding membrane protein